MKRLAIIFAVLLTAGALSALVLKSGDKDNKNGAMDTVTVERGNLVEYALAVGHIEPRNEIEVKSKISGVVSKVFAEEGDFVRAGDPLLEIRPDPTPIELAEAKRNVERSELALDNLQRELFRVHQLHSRQMVSEHEYQALEKNVRDAEINLQLSRERLELLESGRILIGETLIESVIKAPADGYILQKYVDMGDPIVPLTSYQAGTALMTLARMDDLIFKGTVDEIDVGKLQEGMAVDIRIGALPGVTVEGELTRISLKAASRDNSTVFPVEIRIINNDGHVLRAGYSANANVVIDRRENILLIPERVVTFNDDKSTVEIPSKENGRKKVDVRLGLSDAIHVEVMEGLEEGDLVLEKPLQSLAVR